ncbi:MAG: methyl-accepting chemotaxis protein [Actinomycetota bacterium]|nr:methyl-accepting chemotaxis protein [Actinomycetota bacterium]
MVAVVGIAAVLLARTVQEAQQINSKAQNIATNGRGINTSTDAVIQLRRTNKLATSILRSATPLEPQLGGIVGTAQGIDGLAGSILTSAGSINNTARTINTSAGAINQSADGITTAAESINSSAGSIGTSAGRVNTSARQIDTSAGAINASAGAVNRAAGSINTTARRINALAGSILPTARLIDRDVRLINQNLDVTLRLVTAVKGDSGNILEQARGANDTAACIDRKLFGATGDDGDCQGQATPTSLRSAPGRLEDLRELLRRRRNGAPSGDRVPTPLRTPAPAPAPLPVPKQGRQRIPLPRPERLLPDTQRELDKILDGLLPGLGQGQGRRGDLLDELLSGTGPRSDLLDELLSGTGPRSDDLLDRLLSRPGQR